MQAIIRYGDGRFYCSPIFGMYYDKNSKQKPFDAYVICFDEGKEKLVRHPLYNPKKKPYLNLMVLATDDDRSEWVSSEDDRYKGVIFLPWAMALKAVKDGFLPGELKKRCQEQDHHEDYSGFHQIKTDAHIRRLMTITGEFHDARIAKSEEQPDGSLYVLFDGVWGCSVELVFSGDVSYCTDSRDPKKWDPYWLGSSAVIKDGYIYFTDDAVDISQLNDNYCWFKARTMKYRIIPE